MAARTLRILDADPESRPKNYTNDTAGRFRAGMQLNNRPVALKAWRVTAGNPKVASAIAELYGGTSEEWETTKDDALQVLTDADDVSVIIESADVLTFRMALYGMQGKPTHVCDGVEFIDSEDPRFGQLCGCPTTLKERKAAAKAGYGPKPDIGLLFRLADDPTLGKFRLSSSSWEFMKSLERTWSDLDAVGAPALCNLKLELVEFTTNSGIDVSYRKPNITVHGRVPEDIDAVVPSLSKVAPEEPPF